MTVFKRQLLIGLFCVGFAGPVFGDGAPPSDQKAPVQNQPGMAQNVDGEEGPILRRVEEYLNGIKSLEAGFIQRGPDGGVAEGTLSLERPGKLRFDYEEDIPLLLVSDGTTLTFVDYEVKQVTRWPIMDTPLGILVAREIDLSGDMIVSTAQEEGGLLRVTIKDPKRKGEGYISLIFEQNPLILRAWDAIDAQGLVTRVTLVNAETNVALSNALFTFKDPRALPFSGRRRR